MDRLTEHDGAAPTPVDEAPDVADSVYSGAVGHGEGNGSADRGTSGNGAVAGPHDRTDPIARDPLLDGILDPPTGGSGAAGSDESGDLEIVVKDPTPFHDPGLIAPRAAAGPEVDLPITPPRRSAGLGPRWRRAARGATGADSTGGAPRPAVADPTGGAARPVVADSTGGARRPVVADPTGGAARPVVDPAGGAVRPAVDPPGPTAGVRTPSRTARAVPTDVPSRRPTERLPSTAHTQIYDQGPAPDPDSTGEIMKRPRREARPLQVPVAVQRARPRVRKVTRVVRHLDPWSVFKVALVFNIFMFIVTLTSGVMLWQVAVATGTIDNIERGFENVGWQVVNLRDKGGEIFHNAWIGGLFVVIAMTGLAVLMATLFNLITDLVGGLRVTVLEEEVQARAERLGPGHPAAAPGSTQVLPRGGPPIPGAAPTAAPMAPTTPMPRA